MHTYTLFSMFNKKGSINELQPVQLRRPQQAIIYLRAGVLKNKIIIFFLYLFSNN